MQSVNNSYLYLILIDLNRLLILIILKELTALLFTIIYSHFLDNIELVMGQGKCRLMVIGFFLLIFED